MSKGLGETTRSGSHWGQCEAHHLREVTGLIHAASVCTTDCGNPLNRLVREAQPGEIVQLYGTGFGPVNPPVPAGRLFDTPNQMTAPVRVRFGDTWVEANGGLASPCLYQIAVRVPDSAPDGDLAVVAEVAGKQSPAAKIPVRRPEP